MRSVSVDYTLQGQPDSLFRDICFNAFAPFVLCNLFLLDINFHELTANYRK